MTSTTIDHLLAAIDAGDRDTLPILADALEEAGDPRAAGVRWLAENGQWPVMEVVGFWERPRFKLTGEIPYGVPQFYHAPKYSNAILDAAQAYIASRNP